MPVSGSFSRSALNLAAGAATGVSSPSRQRPCWSRCCSSHRCCTICRSRSSRRSSSWPSSASWTCRRFASVAREQRRWFRRVRHFFWTLAFAPNIQIGIVAGIIVSLAAFLYRRWRPRVLIVSVASGRHVSRFRPASTCRRCMSESVRSRFDGSCCTSRTRGTSSKPSSVCSGTVPKSSTSWWRRTAHQRISMHPGSNRCAISPNGSGKGGVTLVLAGVKRQVQEVLERTGGDRDAGRGERLQHRTPKQLASLRARMAREEQAT